MAPNRTRANLYPSLAILGVLSLLSVVGLSKAEGGLADAPLVQPPEHVAQDLDQVINLALLDDEWR